MPLMDHLGPELAKDGAVVAEVVKGNLEGVTLPDIVGVIAVRTVQDAFDTQGFGQWKPNTDYTKNWKGSDQPLIDSRQLLAAVNYAVVPA